MTRVPAVPGRGLLHRVGRGQLLEQRQRLRHHLVHVAVLVGGQTPHAIAVQPDIVVMDSDMPILDVRAIKTRGRTPTSQRPAFGVSVR